jgi:hypothetical protein
LAQEIWNHILHQLVHVKSHQDAATEWEKLSFPAMLNVIADEQATLHQNTMYQPAGEVTNLAKSAT